MKVENINQGIQKKPRVNKKHEASIKRVQSEFLKQLSEGKSEKEAFLGSLKAIDEKYNPQKDELSIRYENAVGAKYTAKAFKMPSAESTKKWLEVIAFAVPIITGFVDWIMDKVQPKSKEAYLKEDAKVHTGKVYSTTA